MDKNLWSAPNVNPPATLEEIQVIEKEFGRGGMVVLTTHQALPALGPEMRSIKLG